MKAIMCFKTYLETDDNNEVMRFITSFLLCSLLKLSFKHKKWEVGRRHDSSFQERVTGTADTADTTLLKMLMFFPKKCYMYSKANVMGPGLLSTVNYSPQLVLYHTRCSYKYQISGC